MTFSVFSDADELLLQVDPFSSGNQWVRSWLDESKLAGLNQQEQAQQVSNPHYLRSALIRLCDGRWCRFSWEDIRGKKIFAGRIVSARKSQGLLLDVQPRFADEQAKQATLETLLQTDIRAEDIKVQALTPSGTPSAKSTARLEQITAMVDSLTDDDWEDTTPLIRKLLLYMKSRERADLSDLCPAVWGEDCANVSDRARDTLVSKANRFLSKRPAKWRLSKLRGQPVLLWQ